MDITPGQWALIAGMAVLILLHFGVFISIRKVEKRIKKLEEQKK